MLQHVEQLIELIALENNLHYDIIEKEIPDIEEFPGKTKYLRDMEDGVTLTIVADEENELFHVYTESGIAQASVRFESFDDALEEVMIYADQTALVD